MVKSKKQPVEEDTPLPAENPAKFLHLQKLLVKAEHGKEFKFAQDIEQVITSTIGTIKDSINEGQRQVLPRNEDRYVDRIADLRVEYKKKDIVSQLIKLGLMDGALPTKEINKRLSNLNSSMPRIKSAIDPDLEMEDFVGIGSVRRVKNLVSLTGNVREDEEEAKKKAEEAKEFVKKQEEERKQRIKYRHDFIKKTKERQKKLKEKEEQKLKEQREKHHEEVIQRYEKTKEKLEEHQKEREENAKPVKLDKEYVHIKLEKKFKQNFTIPSLQQKKQQLENLRNFYKPIKREELDEHEKNFLITLKQKQDQKRLKREQEYKDMGIGTYDPSKYKSKALKETIEKEKEQKLHKYDEENKIKDKAAKRENYAKLVKQMHWPEVSPKKKAEMNLLKKSLEVKSKPFKRKLSERNLTNTDTESRTLKRHHATRSQAKIDWAKFHNPMIPREQPKRAPVVVDYLMERRLKRETGDEVPSVDQNNPFFDWKDLVDKALDEKDYQGMVKEKARVIENQARFREAKARATDNIEDEAQANDLMISALEAKLSILNNIK